ncbi:MAG: hypothetical protein SFU87_12795 [Chitinophagaceae bacterium]|nr:hypothetical protein [Chitinophagaceae bacterium]
MANIRIHLFLLAGTALIFLLLRIQGEALTVAGVSPRGILSLEFAKTSPEVTHIISNWKEQKLLHTAQNNILLDFLFIPFYSLLFYSICGSISVHLQGFASKSGVFLAFGSFIAGWLDVFENILMLFSVHQVYTGFSALLTFIFAFSKFSLLALAFLYVLLFGMKLVITRKMM